MRRLCQFSELCSQYRWQTRFSNPLPWQRGLASGCLKLLYCWTANVWGGWIPPSSIRFACSWPWVLSLLGHPESTEVSSGLAAASETLLLPFWWEWSRGASVPSSPCWFWFQAVWYWVWGRRGKWVVILMSWLGSSRFCYLVHRHNLNMTPPVGSQTLTQPVWAGQLHQPISSFSLKNALIDFFSMTGPAVCTSQNEIWP